MKNKRVFSLFLSVIFLVSGIGLVYYYNSTKEEFKQSKNWNITEGKVLTSYLKQSRESYRKGKRYVYRIKYLPEITYSYKVGDTKFTGNRIAFGAVGSKKLSEAQAILSKYPEGSTVEVFYNPDNPGQAVLERRFNEENRIIFYMGIVFFLGGIILFLNFFKRN